MPLGGRLQVNNRVSVVRGKLGWSVYSALVINAFYMMGAFLLIARCLLICTRQIGVYLDAIIIGRWVVFDIILDT